MWSTKASLTTAMATRSPSSASTAPLGLMLASSWFVALSNSAPILIGSVESDLKFLCCWFTCLYRWCYRMKPKPSVFFVASAWPIWSDIAAREKRDFSLPSSCRTRLSLSISFIVTFFSLLFCYVVDFRVLIHFSSSGFRIDKYWFFYIYVL